MFAYAWLNFIPSALQALVIFFFIQQGTSLVVLAYMLLGIQVFGAILAGGLCAPYFSKLDIWQFSLRQVKSFFVACLPIALIAIVGILYHLNVEAGDRNFKVNAADTTTTVINANVMVDPNTNYSLFAINRLSSIDALLLVDDLTAPASGKAHVLFAHLSPDAPAVDVTLTTGTVLFGNASFKSVTAFTQLDAGTYNLQARVAGTSTVALEIPNVTLTAGKIYTVFARGFLTPPAGNTNALGVTIIANN